MNPISCPLCGCSADTPSESFSEEGGHVRCSVCGEFFIPWEVWADHFLGDSLSKRQKSNLSAGVYRRYRPKLTENVFDEFLKEQPPGVMTRLEDLLLHFSRIEGGPQGIEISEKFRPIVWAESYQELSYFIDLLAESNQITRKGNWCKLSLQGWQRVQELTKQQGSGEQCFVAMSFSPALESIYTDGLEPGILAAGYRPLRIDRSEHANRIDDEIVTQIRRSRFMVADFTEQKPGVYYEAGFAQGLGIPVIWSCSNEDLKKLHFDVRQYNCLRWTQDGLAEFSQRLQFRIESLIGLGPISKK